MHRENTFVYEAGTWDRTDSLGKCATNQRAGFSASMSTVGKHLSAAHAMIVAAKSLPELGYFFLTPRKTSLK